MIPTDPGPADLAVLSRDDLWVGSRIESELCHTLYRLNRLTFGLRRIFGPARYARRPRPLSLDGYAAPRSVTYNLNYG